LDVSIIFRQYHSITRSAAIPYELDLWASADAEEWAEVVSAARATELAVQVYRWACADPGLSAAHLADDVHRLLSEAAHLVESVRQAAHDFAVADMFDQRGYLTWGRGLPSIEFTDLEAYLGDGSELTEAHERRRSHRDDQGRVIGHLSAGQAAFLHDMTAEAFAATPIADEVGKLQRGEPPDHDEIATFDMTDEQKELFLATTWVTLDVGTGSRASPEPQLIRGRQMAAMAWGVSYAEWIAQENANDIFLDYQFPFAGHGGWGTPAWLDG
jgi:hypothetical protein